MPDQVRRPRLDRGDAQGDARDPPPGAVGRRRSRRRTPRAVRPRSSRSTTAPATGGIRSQHPPILGEEFEQRELLAMEKETMGTFLSDHPLSQVREALRVRSDCTPRRAREEARRRPGDGRRDRRRGQEDPDQDGRRHDVRDARRPRGPGRDDHLRQDAWQSNEGLIDTDAVLLVRGRVDRKDRGEIKLVVFDAETFEPTSDEVETAKEEVRKLAEPGPLPAATRRRRLRPFDHRGAQVGVRQLPRRGRGRARDEDP